MSHHSVKTALVTKLVTDLPARITPTPWVAISDVQPEDTKRWPFVIVRTTRMTGHTNTGARAQMRCVYRCEVTCGVRSGESDRTAAFAAATADRDTLVQAVRDVLRWSRGLAAGARIGETEWTETTGPAVLDGQGPAIALGNITFDVHALETTGPPPDDPPVVATDVAVATYPHPVDTIVLTDTEE